MLQTDLSALQAELSELAALEANVVDLTRVLQTHQTTLEHAKFALQRFEGVKASQVMKQQALASAKPQSVIAVGGLAPSMVLEPDSIMVEDSADEGASDGGEPGGAVAAAIRSESAASAIDSQPLTLDMDAGVVEAARRGRMQERDSPYCMRGLRDRCCHCSLRPESMQWKSASQRARIHRNGACLIDSVLQVG